MNSLSCPRLVDEKEIIQLAHGSGGRQTARLIEELFLPAFANEKLSELHDGAVVEVGGQRIVFTTDSYVVNPPFFPGGDIGKLAVTGTVNDLAMCGAKAAYLSLGLIIEEGFLQSDLKRIVASIQKEAKDQGVEIVTGDTKVIERQSGKNIFINTSGIGIKMVDYPINPAQIQTGDAIVISGDIGRHGMAVMAARENLSFSSPLMSDCASLFPMVSALIQEGITLHCLRDLTRGGVATALVELAEGSKKQFQIEGGAVAVSQAVQSLTEILGIDPLYVANEGRLVAFLPKEQAERALKILRSFPDGREAAIIGEVLATPSSRVIYTHPFGTTRSLFRLDGDQLPRIC